jgi:hypothetical protein
MAALDVPAFVKRGDIDASVASHRIRRAYENSKQPFVIAQKADVTGLIADKGLPNPQEQLESLILWVGSQQKHPTDNVSVAVPRLAAIMGCAIAPGEGNLSWIEKQTSRSGLYLIAPGTGAERTVKLALTMSGWKLYHELARRTLASRTIFMAMDFKQPELDMVVETCFKPAAERAGFDLRKLTDGQGAGLIDNQIRTRIRSARLVIADLTHDNNGAYFEAGFAEGLGLDVIYTCRADRFKEKKTHFDTNHMVTIPWNLNDLPRAQDALTATIRNTLPDMAKMTD